MQHLQEFHHVIRSGGDGIMSESSSPSNTSFILQHYLLPQGMEQCKYLELCSHILDKHICLPY